MNKNILKHVIRYILIICIIVLCCKIFALSSQDGDVSAGTSRQFTEILLKTLGLECNDRTIEIINPVIRKVAHFSVYMLLGFLTMCTCETFKWQRVYKFDFSTMFAFVFACSDELHQRLVPGRSGEFADVCLDTVGAMLGVLIVLAIALICVQIKKKKASKPKKLVEENSQDEPKRKVLFIASTGGHLNELMQLKTLFKKYDYHIVTENTKVDKSLKKKYGDKMSFLIYGTKKYPISYIFKFIANSFISLYYFFKYQPEVIVTTGTHTAVPMCYIAKIFGSKVIFIETFANRTSGTVAGKLVYPIADTFVVQWEEMHKIYPKSVCWGWLY
ncbi:MAG: PssD/Cps14F family polysaccharide biosynthesis glycosyltransferase [Clostridia bacterium]